MSDLIEAAKAVIEWFDDDKPSDLPIENLIAAVDRAEKTPADFEEWWVRQNIYPCSKLFAKSIWIAAQQAAFEKYLEDIRRQDEEDRDEILYELLYGQPRTVR